MLKDVTINILAEPVKELVCPECEHAIDVSGFGMLSPIECPECGSALTVPARLGKFILVEALGAGGMATVYKAYDESLGRYVAIKIMRRKFGEDPKFVERFLREARAAARINHPNVVQIYSCAEKHGQPYIVMEFVDGGKFDQQIANDAPLDEKLVLDVAMDVANGLRAASDIGLVHGDIKPANIIFDRNGMAKVADFGLAHFAQEKQDSNEIWGTPYYIAPERARKKRQDQRADIYCLGASLFHALAGEPPFDGETAVDVVMERLKHPAPNLLEIRPELSETTAKVIGRMLEEEKIRRYPNYNSLISDLEKALDKLSGGFTVGKSSTIGRAKEAKTKPRRSGGKKFAIATAILILLAALAGGGWWLLQSSKQKQPEKPSEETPVAQKPSLQPFDPERDAGLSEILSKLTPSTSIASDTDLSRLYQGMASEDPRRLWCQLLRGVTFMLQGQNDEAVSQYENVVNADTDSKEASLPQGLASFMAGKSDSLSPDADMEWPEWYSDLGLLFEGLKSLANQNTDIAASKLQAFINVEPESEAPSWPYSLQEFARDLDTRVEAWKQLTDEVDKLAAENKFDQAVKMLRDRVKTGLFLSLRDAKISEIEEARKPYLEKRREEERLKKAEQDRKKREEEQAQARAEDQQRLDRWNSEGKNLLKQNKYAEASELLQQLTSQMTTDASKSNLKSESRDLEFLTRMKDFLVAAINSAPYAGARNILNGTAVAATKSDITIRVQGGAGRKTIEWSQITPRVLMPMSSFYLGQAKIDNSWKAEVFMGLSVYSELNDLGSSKRFIKFAEQLKPGISK